MLSLFYSTLGLDLGLGLGLVNKHFSFLYPDHESSDLPDLCVSQNDNHDDDNIGDFLDLSFSEGFLDQSEPDEKPKSKTEISSASVVTILFRKNEKPKIKNLKKSEKSIGKKKANGHKRRLDECFICNRYINILAEDVHDKESLFH